MIKLNKTIKEEKKKVVDCPFEDVIKQSEISKKNREEVMKERTIENNPVSDIDATIKASKIEAPKKNKFNVVESFLKEGYNYSVDNNMFTVNVVDRKALGKLADYLKENKVNYLIKRSVVEGFRYDVTIGQNSKVKSLNKGIKHNPEEKKVFALDLREGGVWKHINLINISDKDKNEVERFKNTLRDQGIYFEPSSDGNYVHFEVSCKSDDDVKFVDDYLRGVGINPYREEELTEKKLRKNQKKKNIKEVCPKCGKEPCVCEKMIYLGSNRPVNEELKLIMTLGDYEPWSGAVDLWEEIQEADKVDELEFMLEDCYPEGLTVTQLNDILWFESDWVREQLGLVDVPEDEEDEEE